MAKKTSPQKKSPAKSTAKPATKAPAKTSAKKPTPKPTPKPAGKSTRQTSAAKPTKKAPAQNKSTQKNPAKRKPKEPAVLTAKSARPQAAPLKKAPLKKPQTKPARNSKTAPESKTRKPSPTAYLVKVTHWPHDVFAGLGKMIQKAAPAKDVAAESLGWLKSRAIRVKQAGQHELHELVRVASKLKELRGTPAPSTAKRTARTK